MRVSNFLLFCSGVSRKVLDKCPESEVIKHSSIGTSVLFTAILAMISSHFAFSLIFDGFWRITALASFWGLIIFNLDRYIVSTLRKNGNFLRELIQISPRLVLSVAIALVIAKPLELQIFKSEIEQELYRKLNENTTVLETKFQERIAYLDLERKRLNQELREYFDLKENYYREYRCECDGTCGTGKVGNGKECYRKKKKYEDFELEYKSKEASISLSLSQLVQNKVDELILLKEDKERLKSNFSFGLLSRIQALNNLNSWETWTVTLLILFIEIAPVLTKLFSPHGPYDELLVIEDANFKFDYTKNLHRFAGLVSQNQVLTKQDVNLIKKEQEDEKQKLVKDLYQDLRQKLAKQLKK